MRFFCCQVHVYIYLFGHFNMAACHCHLNKQLQNIFTLVDYYLSPETLFYNPLKWNNCLNYSVAFARFNLIRWIYDQFE